MRLGVIGVAVLAAAVAACGGSDDGASGCDPDSSLTIGAEDSLRFDAETYDAATGCVEVTYENDGSIAHTLLIEDVQGFKLSVGDTARGTVALEPGEHRLYCDVAGHEQAGMVADLSVTE
jgi:uncharacterized cupredoxin-like copper-binding protein